LCTIDLGVVEEKSSHYGLYMLGFTCATKADTKRDTNVSYSKSLKTARVRIVGWNSSTWSWNR